MPKIYYPPADHTYVLLNEDVWFRRYQNLLLAIVNTSIGRDLLCVPKEYPVITRMYKSAIHWRNLDGTYGADFRIGSKWANVVRSRFDAFNGMSRYFLTNVSVPISPLVMSARSLCALSLTAYPDPDPETTTFDGRVAYAAGANWATTHDASSSASHDTYDSGAALYPQSSSDVSNFANIGRVFILFNTASLTSSAVVSAGTVSMYCTNSSNGINDGKDYVTIVTSSPASNTGLVDDDFDQCGAISNPTKQSNDIDISGVSTSAYQDWTLNATGISNISLTGITKFGAREGHDQENSSVTGSGSRANWLELTAAENAGTSQDPKLVVTYTTVSPSPLPVLII